MVFYDLIVNYINLSPHCPPTLPLCPPKTLRATFLHTWNWDGQQWVWQNIRWQFSVWTNFKTQIKFSWIIQKCVDIPSHFKLKWTTGEEWQTVSLEKHSTTVWNQNIVLLNETKCLDIPSHWNWNGQGGEEWQWVWQNIRWQFSVWANFKTQIKFHSSVSSSEKNSATFFRTWNWNEQQAKSEKNSTTVWNLNIVLLNETRCVDIPSHLKLKQTRVWRVKTQT